VANPLSRTIMNNIVNKVGEKSNGVKNLKENKTLKSNLSEYEEKLLKGVLNKDNDEVKKKTKSKITLDELVGNKGSRVKKESTNKKMVTLDDLLGNEKHL